MPIKSLELYLFERGLVGSYPIESLSNTTLGIDVNHYVSRLLTSKKEQFLDAIGGFPTSLKMYLESDLKIFKEYKITPVFIFNGSATLNQLDAQGYFTAAANETSASSNTSDIQSVANNGSSQSSKTNKELMLFQRHKAWTQWSNLLTNNQDSYIDQPTQPQEPFRYNTTIEPKRYRDDLISYFIEHDIIYQVAPFTSWSQLSYLLSRGYIDAIYGPTDCLLLKNVDKFILGMEFPNKDFRFIDKTRVLKEFHCSHEEFIDISMAVGNDLQSYTLPPLQIYPSSKLFEIALEMVLNTGTNFYAYQLSNPAESNSSKHIERYQRGVASLKYMPVLFDNGKVDIYTFDDQSDSKDDKAQGKSATNTTNTDSKINSPIEGSPDNNKKATSIPNDIHDVVGQRLPNEYYFYRSLGLGNGKVLDSITTGVYPEESPLDGGSSNSYRDLITKSVENFKNKELNLLTQSINRYFQMKPIKQVKWYSLDNKSTLLNRASPSIFDQLNHIVVKTGINERDFSIKEFIDLINNSNDISADFISNDVIFPNSVPREQKLTSGFDLLSTTFLRSLVQLGFFQYEFAKKSLKPTSWGSVLLKLNELNIDAKFHQVFLILLVFFKQDVLSLAEEIRPSIRSSLSDHTLRSYPQESLYILVLTRMLTLFQVEQKPNNYHGLIDKKTLVYREHLDFVRENMAELFESILISSLTSNEFDRLSFDNNTWQQEIIKNIPFKNSLPNTVMAMMQEFFLQKYLHNGNAKADALTLVATEFSTYKSIPNLEEQFKLSVEYLGECNKLLNEMAKLKIIKQEEASLFADAVEFSKNAIYD